MLAKDPMVVTHYIIGMFHINNYLYKQSLGPRPCLSKTWDQDLVHLSKVNLVYHFFSLG
jgi:hypothetical protein